MGRILFLIAVGAYAWVVWLSVHPGGLANLFLALLFAIPAGFLLFVALILDVRFALARKESRRPILRWGARHLLLFFAVATVVLLGLPRRIAFAVSRGSLEEAAARSLALAEDGRWVGAERVGAFSVDERLVDEEGGVWFVTGESGLLDPVYHGFVFRPGAVPPCAFSPADRLRLDPVSGDWYEFVVSER